VKDMSLFTYLLNVILTHTRDVIIHVSSVYICAIGTVTTIFIFFCLSFLLKPWEILRTITSPVSSLI
jgi:hypothetical protein